MLTAIAQLNCTYMYSMEKELLTHLYLYLWMSIPFSEVVKCPASVFLAAFSEMETVLQYNPYTQPIHSKNVIVILTVKIQHCVVVCHLNE